MDVNYVMNHNMTFASHEVTAIANHIDINNDGVVNNADLSVMLANFGGNCF